MYARKAGVLVIDAGQLYRRVQEVLQAEGYDVFKASTYSRGVAMAYSHRPDLVLLDMDIASSDTINALDCCTLIRQTLSMPIIAVSAVDDIQKKVRTLDVGADDYLVKPCGINELLARVHAHVRRYRQSRLFSIPQHKAHHKTLV